MWYVEMDYTGQITETYLCDAAFRTEDRSSSRCKSVQNCHKIYNDMRGGKKRERKGLRVLQGAEGNCARTHTYAVTSAEQYSEPCVHVMKACRLF